METPMSHRDAGENRPHAAPDQAAAPNLHLLELYRLQPLPDEFMRMAQAIGESCGRALRGNKGWFFR